MKKFFLLVLFVVIVDSYLANSDDEDVLRLDAKSATVYRVSVGNGKNDASILLRLDNNIFSQYHHLKKVLVKLGDRVQNGQIIGISSKVPNYDDVSGHLMLDQ